MHNKRISKRTDVTVEAERAWYPIRVTYGREMKFKFFLDSNRIANFLPMHYRECMIDGILQRKLVPVIHNLVFVFASRKELDDIKIQINGSIPIRYIMDRSTGQPMIIADKQMQSFIAVAGSPDEQVIYLDSVQANLKKGDRVRVTDGIWKGTEGVLVRIKRNKRVLVYIQGIVAVATTYIHPSLLEIINEDNE